MRRDVQWWLSATRRLPKIPNRLNPATVVNLIYVVLALDVVHTIYWLVS